MRSFLLVLLISGTCFSQELKTDFIPSDQRQRFYNTDGSCVQCSIGMVGVWLNEPAAEMLLWNSEYGKAVRGGSGPDRVQQYCDDRGISAYNVTGDTVPWVMWALKTNRKAAILWGSNHFVTAVGISLDGEHIAICDNNSPRKIQWMTISQFRSRHMAWGRRGQSFGWTVILRKPSGPPREVKYLEWWKESSLN